MCSNMMVNIMRLPTSLMVLQMRIVMWSVSTIKHDGQGVDKCSQYLGVRSMFSEVPFTPNLSRRANPLIRTCSSPLAKPSWKKSHHTCGGTSLQGSHHWQLWKNHIIQVGGPLTVTLFPVHVGGPYYKVPIIDSYKIPSTCGGDPVT